MRFLVDAQLPPALARWLTAQGHEAAHVADHGLESAADPIVWARAEADHAVLITKDEDFAVLRARFPEGPQVVWIRRGNVSRRELLAWVEPLFPDICIALGRGEALVEVF